jgi:tetratricopeptide (TPR) repeat protein
MSEPSVPNETGDPVPLPPADDLAPTREAPAPSTEGPADQARTVVYAAAAGSESGADRETHTPAAACTTGPDGTPVPAPEMVAGYELLELLGRGAMGVVYKARQPGLKRLVALKMVLAGSHAGAHELARFRAEAEAVARLQHPGIVQLHEVGEHDGVPFFSLEFVDGGSLARKIDSTPQAPRQAAEWVREIALAVGYAHAHGVIHRDLKPANILLTAEGQLKIADFGLARRLDDDQGLSQSGAVMGTPSYMAPEQAEGNKDVGPPADVYALGAILYELLTGRAPFKGDTLIETIEQVRTREPVAPAQLQPGVPRDLETICLTCLQKSPGKRYASALALAEDLRRFLDGEPITARPVGRGERLWRWCRRNPRLAVLSGTVVLLLVAWGITSSALAWSLKRQKDETERARVEADENARAAHDNAARAERSALLARQRHANVVHYVIMLGERMQQRLRARRMLAGGPDAKRLRDDLLDVLRRTLLQMASEMEDREVTSFARAATHQQLGDLLKKLGQGEEALRQYRQGTELVERVVQQQPDNEVARANLGVMLLRLGDMALELNGDAAAARRHYARAHELHEEVSRAPQGKHYTPLKCRIMLSHDAVRLGKAELALGDPPAARRHFEEARTARRLWTAAEPASAEAKSYLSEADLLLGTAAWRLGDDTGAADAFERARRACAELAEKYPRDLSFQADLADVLDARGEAELRLGRAADALQSHRQALEAVRKAVDQNPDDLSRQMLLALTHERLAQAEKRLKQPEADRDAREALRLREELAQTEPNNLTWRAAYLLALARAGKQPEASRGATELAARAAGPSLLLDAARCHALCAATDTAQKQRHTDRALRALQAAADQGYADAIVLRTDPDLESLRNEPAFRALLDRLAAKK